MPVSPPGWLVTTARNRALDRLRRQRVRRERHTDAEVLGLAGPQPVASPEEVVADQHGHLEDDRLRLVFTALSLEALVALTLWLVGGLTTEEVPRVSSSPRRRWASG